MAAGREGQLNSEAGSTQHHGKSPPGAQGEASGAGTAQAALGNSPLPMIKPISCL